MGSVLHGSARTTPRIRAEVLRVLHPGGCVVWNVAAAAGDLETRRVVGLLRTAGLDSHAEPVHGDDELTNTLVLGWKPPAPISAAG